MPPLGFPNEMVTPSGIYVCELLGPRTFTVWAAEVNMERGFMIHDTRRREEDNDSAYLFVDSLLLVIAYIQERIEHRRET